MLVSINRKHELRHNPAALDVMKIKPVLSLDHQIPFLPTEKSHLDTPLEENVNRIIPEEGTVEARSIEDAIAVLRYHLYCVGHHFVTNAASTWRRAWKLAGGLV